MSDNERVRGRLIKTDITEEEAKSKLFELGFDESYYCESWRHTLANETNDYCFLNDDFYEVKDFARIEDLYGCQMTELEDGSLLFDAIYYNGGAHWTEVIEDAIAGKRHD